MLFLFLGVCQYNYLNGGCETAPESRKNTGERYSRRKGRGERKREMEMSPRKKRRDY